MGTIQGLGSVGSLTAAPVRPVHPWPISETSRPALPRLRFFTSASFLRGRLDEPPASYAFFFQYSSVVPV
jgi:hypothetical protein